jgi:hypothetical protein
MRPYGSEFLYWMVFVSAYRDGVLIAKMYANLFVATFFFGPIAAIATLVGGTSPRTSSVIGLLVGFIIATITNSIRHNNIFEFYNAKGLDVSFRGRILWTIYLITMFVLLAGFSASNFAVALLVLLIFLLTPAHRLVSKR